MATTPTIVAVQFSRRDVARSNMAQILKNIGIGWLTLVVVASLAMLFLAVSNGGRTVAYSELPIVGLLASPGLVLLSAGLVMERMSVGWRRGARTVKTTAGEASHPARRKQDDAGER
jgi:hypothetical protein